MERFKISHELTEKLPIEYFKSSSLIGSDILKEQHVSRIEQEIKEDKILDPTIVYEHKGAKFIIEGNQRAGTYGKLKMDVPCVVIRSEEDFQKLKKMGIKIGKLANFQTLKDAHSALAEHMWDIRRDKYWEYFDEEEKS